MIAGLALPASAHSQLPVALAPATQNLPPLGSRVRIRAEGIFGGRQTGTVLRRSGDTLTLSIRGEDPVAVPLSRISSLEMSLGTSRRRGMIRGAIVIGAIGASINALDASFGNDFCTRQCPPNEFGAVNKRVTAGGLLIGAGIGAALGSFLGAFWPTESWQRVDPLPRVSIGVAPRGLMTAGLTFALP
jgi:hypothetical protein